ncbi:MAG TPA: hypothetical protein VGM90_00335 [Kofleriaceae bacterium]|jgi:hypothetical protein
MGKFVGYVVLTPEQAEGDELDHEVMNRLCELGTDEGVEGGWNPCVCVGTVAQELTADIVRATFGNDRRRYETFIAQHPQFAHVPYKGWADHRDPAYVAVLTPYLRAIRDFRDRTFAEHPMRDQPEANHKLCNGTGKVFVEGRVARDGFFNYPSSIIHSRGRLEDLSRSETPFSLFFPDGDGYVAAISDIPETWESLGTSWEAAARAIVRRFRTSSYVELTFVD